MNVDISSISNYRVNRLCKRTAKFLQKLHAHCC